MEGGGRRHLGFSSRLPSHSAAAGLRLAMPGGAGVLQVRLRVSRLTAAALRLAPEARLCSGRGAAAAQAPPDSESVSGWPVATSSLSEWALRIAGSVAGISNSSRQVSEPNELARVSRSAWRGLHAARPFLLTSLCAGEEVSVY